MYNPFLSAALSSLLYCQRQREHSIWNTNIIKTILELSFLVRQMQLFASRIVYKVCSFDLMARFRFFIHLRSVNPVDWRTNFLIFKCKHFVGIGRSQWLCIVTNTVAIFGSRKRQPKNERTTRISNSNMHDSRCTMQLHNNSLRTLYSFCCLSAAFECCHSKFINNLIQSILHKLRQIFVANNYKSIMSEFVLDFHPDSITIEKGDV